MDNITEIMEKAVAAILFCLAVTMLLYMMEKLTVGL